MELLEFRFIVEDSLVINETCNEAGIEDSILRTTLQSGQEIKNVDDSVAANETSNESQIYLAIGILIEPDIEQKMRTELMNLQKRM